MIPEVLYLLVMKTGSTAVSMKIIQTRKSENLYLEEQIIGEENLKYPGRFDDRGI